MTKISAIMALYNTPNDFLKATVESILNQTFTDFEFIIVDDASTVDYKPFFEAFNDERIKYFKLEKNAGPGHARNFGIKKAVGEYIAIVDSDDVYKPERFALQSEFLDKNEEISLIGACFRFSNKKTDSTVIEKDNEIKPFLLFNSPFANPLIMFRKNVFIEKNLLYPEDKNFGEDYELWINAMFSNINMANLKDVLMIYTRRRNQLSKTKNKKQELILKSLYQKIFLTLKMEVSSEEIDLHYNINLGHFNKIKDETKITSWLNKIIEQNKKSHLFDEQVLIQKKEEILTELNNSKSLWDKYISNHKKPLDNKNMPAPIIHKSDYPKVSAVMALYNTPYNLLKMSVKSILNQTFSDFELIIVDDGSSLNYKEFLAGFNDKRIKYHKLEKNAGPGHARNTGMKMATGEYIAIVDSDDFYFPNKFELQVNFLANNPDISLVSGAFQSSINKKISSFVENDSDIKLFMLFNSALTNAAAMFRRNVFAEKNLFYPEDKNFGEDYELWIDAMLSGVKMANLKDVLMIYTRRRNQLSKTRLNEQIFILKDLYKKIFATLKIDVSPAELDLHYNIYAQNFGVLTEEEISNWFNKIIEFNNINKFFAPQKLIEKRDTVLENNRKDKNRIFKLKIGEFNCCIYSPFKFTFEKRD